MFTSHYPVHESLWNKIVIRLSILYCNPRIIVNKNNIKSTWTTKFKSKRTKTLRSRSRDHSPTKMIASTMVPFAPSERAISNACVFESSLFSLFRSLLFSSFASVLKISYIVWELFKGKSRKVDLCHWWWRGPMILRRSTASANQIGFYVGIIVAVGYILLVYYVSFLKSR